MCRFFPHKHQFNALRQALGLKNLIAVSSIERDIPFASTAGEKLESFGGGVRVFNRAKQIAADSLALQGRFNDKTANMTGRAGSIGTA